MELAGDELLDGLELWRTDEVPVGAQVSLELIDGVVFASFGGCLTQPIDDDGANDLAEELFLVREVEVNGAFGDAGAACDVVEPRAGEAAFPEDVESGLEDLAGPLFRKPPPAWPRPPRGPLGRAAGVVAGRFVRLGIPESG